MLLSNCFNWLVTLSRLNRRTSKRSKYKQLYTWKFYKFPFYQGLFSKCLTLNDKNFMTHEAKLLKLLQIAVDNGWEREHYSSFKFDEVNCTLSNYHNYHFEDAVELGYSVSLNDLVTDFYESEVSFIEALCKHTQLDIRNFHFTNEIIKENKYAIHSIVKMEWVLQPTSKRLEWLFETFNHLL